MKEKYDTFSGRFWAGFIDGIILLPLVIFDYFFLKPENSLIIVIPWLVFSYTIYFVYSISLHWKFGQTVGKRIMKVIVVDHSETKGLSFHQAIMRDGIPLLIQIIFIVKLLMITVQIGYYNEMSIVQENLILNYISLIWFIIEVITMLTNDKRRALHDFIANTVVINKISENEKNSTDLN